MLTRIDLQPTFKEKLNVDFRRYSSAGASARRAAPCYVIAKRAERDAALSAVTRATQFHR